MNKWLMFQSGLDLHPPWCPSPVNIPGSCLSDQKIKHCSLECFGNTFHVYSPSPSPWKSSTGPRVITTPWMWNPQKSAGGQQGKTNPQKLLLSKSQSRASPCVHCPLILMQILSFPLFFWASLIFLKHICCSRKWYKIQGVFILLNLSVLTTAMKYSAFRVHLSVENKIIKWLKSEVVTMDHLINPNKCPS